MRNILLAILIMLLPNSIVYAKTLPQGFVYISEIDPTIIQNLRYFGTENFMARPIDGYKKPKVILTLSAANALKNIQAEIRNQNYQLVIYDTYHLQRAVNSFVSWSKDQRDQLAKILYYPNIDKKDLFQLNYIAKKSGHCRGSTVDLTLLPLDRDLKKIVVSQRTLKNGEIISYLDDGTIDMGSSFDLFHEASHHDTKLISLEATKNREVLRNIMKMHGFQNYHEEWWHYTLENKPFKDTYFYFEIE